MAAGFYVPLDRATPFYYLALRAGGDPVVLAEPLRRALAAIDPEIDVHRLETLERVGWEDREFMSGFGSALVACGGMALLLSLAGIYALMSFTVTRRTREIGVRVALGAGRRQVLATVLGRAGLHTLAGALLGGLLAQVFLRAKAMLVTRLPAGEPWVVPAVLGLLAGGRRRRRVGARPAGPGGRADRGATRRVTAASGSSAAPPPLPRRPPFASMGGHGPLRRRRRPHPRAARPAGDLRLQGGAGQGPLRRQGEVAQEAGGALPRSRWPTRGWRRCGPRPRSWSSSSPTPRPRRCCWRTTGSSASGPATTSCSATTRPIPT